MTIYGDVLFEAKSILNNIDGNFIYLLPLAILE